MDYTQSEKVLVREETVKSAIGALTSRSKYSTLIDPLYVRKVRDKLVEDGTIFDKEFANMLSEQYIQNWEKYFKANNRVKNANELKVAYFSGPNPENDLEVLVKYGVVPENVWAFESENRIYDDAVMSALNSKYPFLKIYKGKFQNFLEHSPIKFDIIYLDFCGTITSSNTLPVVTALFAKQALSSPGVLITNFSYPNRDNDEKKWLNTIKLAVNYIYPKEFTENFTGTGGGCRESPTYLSESPGDLLKKVKRNPINIYSQFITRTILDLATVIVPAQRFCKNKSQWSLFFNKSMDDLELPSDFWEDGLTFPETQSILSGLLHNQFPFNEGIGQENVDDDSIDNDFSEFLEKYSKNLSVDSNPVSLYNSLIFVSYLMSDGNEVEKMYSQKLEKISKSWDWRDKYIFCDVFLFHQIKDILVRQISVPYHYNLALLRRWTYKAKATRMFQDMFVFDECRYAFDWMPTIDMLESGISDITRQLVLRFVLDGIGRHNHWYNREFLAGTAVISKFKRGFEAKEFRPRKKVN